jgi:hypothetical protein
MQIQDNLVSPVRSACLYGAEKFRRTLELGRKLGNAVITDEAVACERVLLETANMLPVINEAARPLVLKAVDAFIEELNKQAHTLTVRGALQDAGLYEHKLREMYEVRRVLAA